MSEHDLKAALRRCHTLLQDAGHWIDMDAHAEWHAAMDQELLACDESGECPTVARPLHATHPGLPDNCHRVTIQGRYDAATHCVLTSHGETLVVFDTDEGSFAPLDGKQVSVTITESHPTEGAL